MSWTPYRSTPTIEGMNRKPALVTGASRPLGLGFAVARQLAEQDERGDEADDRPAAEAAPGVVWAATLEADRPTGGLFLDGLDARAVGAASP